MGLHAERLIVVSNRLPFVCGRDAQGNCRIQPGSGGLVSALVSVLRRRGGTWIGWLGACETSAAIQKAAVEASAQSGYRLWPLDLSAEEVRDFYQGFSNEVIWPLFHDLQSSCNFDPAYWRAYCEVNRRFAQSIMEVGTADDFVWVHDYQLMNVAAALRKMGSRSRLEAFHNLLTRFPRLREKITLIQVVVPSRVDIPEYGQLKTTIEQMVGRINGEFVRPGGWVPVWYVYDSLSRVDLLSYYRAADIALITPLKDGMNLVAKEYCASSIDGDCVLILSEFAGAAVQSHRGALLVNPYDIEAVADAIKRACEMDVVERKARMRRLRRSIREYDIFWWMDSFMQAAIARGPGKLPLPPDYAASSQQDCLPA